MSPDLREQLQVTLGSAYTLERELGGGGMSRVFVAEESRLQRKVVVKVLTPETAAGMSAERFEREIMLAARLSHPSIVPVLTAGDAAGVPYYTMPFVEGLSLRAKLASSGALEIGAAVSILRDVARALAYAHEQGVVHRDIKPENVLLAGDAAVVSDFGIAKAISAARTGTTDATLTRAGTMMGTPAYMAPEQVTADPAIDHRADLYSFGCLAYELLTGEAPFHGRTTQKVLAAHIGEAPAPIEPRRPDCPRLLALLVMRCLEKEPDRRPQSAREVLQGLEPMSTPATVSTERRAFQPLRTVGAVVALIVLVGAAAALVIGRGGSDETGSSTPGAQSLAVLPFENIGGDTADAYFGDGMAEELGTALSRVAGLSVLARSSVSRFRGQPIDAREVGRTLNVNAVLEGSVRRAATQMRVTARLISVSDGRVVWGESYAREVTDVFAVQDEIARAIVSALQTHLALASAAAAPSGAINRGTADLAAYDLYLRGQFLLRRRGPGVRLAVENFEQAISRDSNFARAYSGLSAALELFPYFVGTPASMVQERAMNAARHALALDSTLAEPHTSLAMGHQHAYQWAAAEREFQKAIALDSVDAASLHQYARFLLYTGRLTEGREQLRRAKQLDPYSAVISSWVSYALLLAGHVDSARAEGERALELDSTNTTAISFSAFSALAAGEGEMARTLVRRLPHSLPWIGTIAYVHGASGDRQTASRIVRELEAQRPRPWFAETAISMGSLGMGDSVRALDALERATANREIWPTFFPLSDPMFGRLRSSTRFAAIARQAGLDPRLFEKR